MDRRSLGAGIAACALALSACSGGANTEGSPTEDPAGDLEIVENSLDTALILTASQLTADPHANTVVSPVSLQIALAMLAAGVDEGTPTHSELTDFLGVEAGEALPAYADLAEQLEQGQGEGIVDVATAWGVRSDGGAEISQSTIDDAAQILDSTVEEGDLTTLQTALDAWTAEASRGLITDLPPLDEDAVLVLLSALYAKQSWAEDPGFTLIDFRNSHGSVSVSRGMSWEGAEVKRTDDFDFAVVPFAGNLRFEALMPTDSVLDAVTASDWDVRPDAKLTVEIPELQLTGEANVLNELEALSLPSLKERSSDITGFTEDGSELVPAVIVQKAALGLDSEGIEAAAVTQIQAVPTMLPIEDPNVLTFDRAFVYRVVDERSGWVLFYGAVNDPNPM